MNISIDSFEIKNYTRKELALLYFPDKSPHNAYRSFMSYVRTSDVLVDLFNKLVNRRNFSKAVVKKIVEELGEP